MPVIGLVQVGQQAMADRYTYISLIGLFIILVWGYADLTASWRYRKIVSIVTALIVLGALTGCTWRQVGLWRDSIALFEHSLAINAKNHLAHNHIGYAYAENGNFDKAIEHHRQALEIKPNYTQALVNLGRELVSTQQYSEAITSYRQAVKNNPKNAKAQNGLGGALLGRALEIKSNDFIEAQSACRTALAIDPYYDSAHLNLAQIFAQQQKFDQAIEQCRQLLRISPNDFRARKLLQELQIRKNRALEQKNEN